MQKRITLAVTAIFLCIITISVLVLPNIIDLGEIPESDELWYTAGPFNLWENETYSIYFHGVNFTFLYIEWVPLDSPKPAHFLVSFLDATSENMTIYTPGVVLFDDVAISNHSSPKAAVYTHGADDVLGKWFCAVSLN